MTAFQVTVAKESLGFSAAHFLTLPGHVCERLHGHNYRVAVRVEGAVDERTGFVVDFAVLKRVVMALLGPLDHRVLVPSRNPQLQLRETGQEWTVDYGRTGWMVLPREHVCLVPVTQTTAERLAEWLTGAAWEALQREGATGLTRLILEVEESAGQSASCTLTRSA